MNTDYILNRVCPALESGEYAQGRKALRLGETYCCLGVMVDLAIRDGLTDGRWAPRVTASGSTAVEYPDSVYDWDGILPDDIRALMGFADSAGPAVTIDGDDYDSLVRANDDGRTFGEIAAALRALAEAELTEATA